MDVSLRVIKEPRGFIRVIQFIMAILAFSTTAGFSTTCEFAIECGIPEKDKDDREVSYHIEYPFTHTTLDVPASCDSVDAETLTLPFDFTNVAQFYVATGVLSFLYTIGILVVYIFFHQTYANNNKVPIIDLLLTLVLAIFWMAGTCAWAQGVADLKYYLHPETIFKFIHICISKDHHECTALEEGTYGVLNASLVLGFANFLLWASNLWFVYKETFLHTPEVPQNSENQIPKTVGRPTDVRKV